MCLRISSGELKMITIKHPQRNHKTFKEIHVLETFILPTGTGVYLKTNQNCFHNAFSYKNSDTLGFPQDQDVIVVDLVIEYSIRN